MSKLVDEAARDRIRTDTKATLFVEAGAGSGKTRSLIDRVCSLVLTDGVPLATIATVTFTEKAGAELRDRLRATFEQRLQSTQDNEERVRAATALDDLDSAAIGTLHSFAQRILTMHPIEAGLPPAVEVLDEVGSSVAFEHRWSELQRQLLDEESLSQTVPLALAAGVTMTHLRSLTKALGNDWDLVDSHIRPHGSPELSLPDVTHLAAQAAALAARADECTNEEDLFLPKLVALDQWGQRLAAARGDREILTVLVDAADLRFSYGRGASWDGALEEIRDSCKELAAAADAARATFVEAVLRPLTFWLAEQVEHAARERAADGRLEFHDLLVLARELLRDNPDVREVLQQKFPYLLLDEFQDTDPIQIELAVRIAGGRDADAEDWRDISPPAGSLFVVGDPKQSIYRFRRADIGLYLAAQDWFEQDVQLSTNFRTTEPLLDWVNAVFGELIAAEPGKQPAYQALAPHRPATSVGPAVTVLGAAQHAFANHGKANELRKLEAEDVAAVIRRAINEGWTILDEQSKAERPLRLEDIAILVPARTSVPALETALDRGGVPYRIESSSLVYRAQEIRDLMAAARAVADPSDVFACVTALRSPLFGCGDDDLWTWKRDGGSFHLLAPTEDSKAMPEHPVGRAMTYLRDLHRRSRWLTPSEVLAALVVDRRMLEVAAEHPRARDQWRRVRFVVDQARAWSEAEQGGLRAYLMWAAMQGEESARVAEAVLPETDVDAVRIMTIHAAKGLEFPMVVLSGMTSAPRPSRGVQLLWHNDGYAVSLNARVQTSDFNEAQPLEEQMDEYERRRLLYVATTRARDHLAVSVHRGTGSTVTHAHLLAGAGAAEAPGAMTSDAEDQQATGEVGGLGRKPLGPPPEHAEWLAWLERARQAARSVPAQSASGLEGTEPQIALREEAPATELAKGGRDVELPAWSKGRHGTATGRAVHGVLQAVDLATGEGLDDAVVAQSVAEGVTGSDELVRQLARSALDSDLVRRAAARPHWRETYAGTVQADGTVLEGFIDLIFRDDDGTLVVVDYKTDAVPAEALPARVEHYRPQIDAYCQILAEATGEVVHGVLLFLDAERAVVHALG